MCAFSCLMVVRYRSIPRTHKLPNDFVAAASPANGAPRAPSHAQGGFQEMIPVPLRPFLAARARPPPELAGAEFPEPCLAPSLKLAERDPGPVQIDAPGTRRWRASTAFPKHDH